MRKGWFILLAIAVLLVGCSSNKIVFTSKPPKMNIEVNNKTYATTLGTYCWDKGCVDTVGPVELLEGKEAIEVSAGDKLELQLNGSVKDTDFHLSIESNGQTTEVLLNNYTFVAPNEPGIYYYSCGVWWNGSNQSGDAFYAFKLEVK